MSVALVGLTILQVSWALTGLSLKRERFDGDMAGVMARSSVAYEQRLSEKLLRDNIEVIEFDSSIAVVVDGDTMGIPQITEINLDLRTLGLKPGQQRLDAHRTGHWMEAVLERVIRDAVLASLPFESKSDVQLLESIIRDNMERAGLSLPVVVMIMDPVSEERLVNTEAFRDVDLRSSPYQLALFQTQNLEASLMAYLHFPDRMGYLNRSIWSRMILSVVFLSLIILIFGLSLWIILRQKRMSEIRRDFINNMTHEFKTPVTSISLAAQALRDPDISKDEARLERLGRMIMSETRKVDGQIERILQMAALDQEELQIKHEEVNMHDIVEGLVENIELTPGASEPDIKLRLQADRPVVRGDMLHLTNVVGNLIDNAIKYSKATPVIEIVTDNTEFGFHLSVKDRGIGMTKDAQRRVFERFYRQPNGNLHNVKGFGLGLSYVKEIVDAHKGSVTVDSKEGQGSTFEVLLPVPKA